MSTDIIMIGMGMVVLAINCTTMILTFPSKRGLPFTVGALVLFTIVFYSFLYFTGVIVPDNGGLPGLAYLPVMILLFKGRFFQKVFAYFLQFLLTAFQVTLAQTVGGIFMQHGERAAFTFSIVMLFFMFAVYVTLVFKFGRHFFERLFEYGQLKEWIFYSLGAIFSFAILTISQISPGSTEHIIFVLFFILWSFAVLCFAIINTHEKLEHRYEAELARDIISSGRGHYQKMNEMYDAIRTIRHDYKYHLDVIGELLNTDNKNEAEKYLADIQKQFPKSELPNHCSNPVLNAMLAAYYERCRQLHIKFDIEISIPGMMSIPNYEMCIVIGNLMENAVYACEQQEGSRKIELVVNSQEMNLAVKVKNSFNGEVVQNDSFLVSMKKDGGLGLRSVQAVAARYGGELMTEWDDAAFSAYVLMKL